MSWWRIGYAHLIGFKIWDRPEHPAFVWEESERDEKLAR